LAGHHFDINLRVANELVLRGHHVHIFANRGFVPPTDLVPVDGLQITPLFGCVPYAKPTGLLLDDQWAGELRHFYQTAHQFTTELKTLGYADLWLMPTLFAYQLMALSHVGIHPPVIAGIHNAPTFPLQQGNMLWRLAFIENSSRTGQTTLGIFETELLLEYESLLSHGFQRIHEWAIPHDGVPTDRVRDCLVTVGILGHQRKSKGLREVPKLVNDLVKRGYRVVLNDSAEKIKVESGNFDKLVVFGRVPHIGTLIQACDVVLLNYDPMYYRFSGSGIAWEALACGVPVLAPIGTTVSRTLKQYGAGATFCPHDPNSLFQELDAMKADYGRHYRRAQDASGKYKSVHGTARFVDQILAIPA
jgi:glycosyltransferase involved in cell wall biosynthesis